MLECCEEMTVFAVRAGDNMVADMVFGIFDGETNCETTLNGEDSSLGELVLFEGDKALIGEGDNLSTIFSAGAPKSIGIDVIDCELGEVPFIAGKAAVATCAGISKFVCEVPALLADGELPSCWM